jgi:O-antigen/teichoic acid export membrane protein
MVLSISSSLDVLLFQLAVRADEQLGMEDGHDQIARNMGVIFAIVTPACVGVWLTLPSIEHLVVPEQFRGPFQHYFSMLLPGQFAFGMFAFAIVPYFLIAKRTLPMIFAATLACLTDVALIFLLPTAPTSIALAQSGAMFVGLAVLAGNAVFSGARFPPARDILGSIAGVGTMTVVLLPFRAAEPGILVLATQALVGMAIYGVFVFGLDIAGLRGVGFEAARTLRAKLA